MKLINHAKCIVPRQAAKDWVTGRIPISQSSIGAGSDGQMASEGVQKVMNGTHKGLGVEDRVILPSYL